MYSQLPLPSYQARRSALLMSLVGLFLLTLLLTRQPTAASPDNVVADNMVADYVVAGNAVADSNAVANDAVNPGWESPLLLSPASYGPIIQMAPNGAVMLAYGQATSGTNNQINPTYRILPAGSGSWSTAARIHSSPANFSQVTFQFDVNSVAHAVWRSDTAVFYAAQPSWASNSFSIVFNNAPNLVFDPQIAVNADGVIHVVAAMQNPAFVNLPPDIHHAYSTNNGDSWITTNITNNNRRSAPPDVAVDADGNVHIVWEERTPIDPGDDPDDPNHYAIYYQVGTKTEEGYSWQEAVVISGSVLKARQPGLVAKGNDLYLTFTDLVSPEKQFVYYTSRPANGSWQTPVNVTDEEPLAVNTNAPYFLVSSITFCEDDLYIVYYGSLVFNANEQVFVQQLKDGVWRNRETVTSPLERRVRSSAVCRDGTLNLVYEQLDNPNINHQIYYTIARELIFLPVINRN
jgi:hypothetical protein